MISIGNDQLLLGEPGGESRLNISLQRTVRVADDGSLNPLPAGLGYFPLRHVQDYAERLPKETLKRGGVLVPMHDHEATWINFAFTSIDGAPMALKVAAGMRLGRLRFPVN